MLRRFSKILLLTVDAATGGPEAICQLGQILRELGFDASILAYRFPEEIQVEGGMISHPPFERTHIARNYRRYKPDLVDSARLTEDTLVILPETRIHLAYKLAPATTAVWWLSVANAYFPGSILKTNRDFRLRFFSDRSIIHLCQTYQSRKMLSDFGAGPGYELVDYTDPRFTFAKPTAPNAGSAIAFNANKGADLSERFFALHPEFTPLPIGGMKKLQVREALSSARVYVEFGDNPGRDRMPREAACAGAIVLAKREGGSRHFEDTPIPGHYKFGPEAVTDGRLAEALRTIAADPRPHWDAQAYYRNWLFTEQALMQVQARRIFDI